MSHSPDELIPTRATLLHRLKNLEDQDSWQAFFDTYWRLIYGVALKGGLSVAEAEEVVQETMISVAKHMPGFKYNPAVGSFKGWLLNMTRWRMADQFRRRSRPDNPLGGRQEDVSAENHEFAGASELEQLWEAEWEDNLLRTAIDRARRAITPRQYQIFDCNVNKGWSAEKVAKAFGIPIGQVYLAKHRVTEAIKQEVERLKRDVI